MPPRRRGPQDLTVSEALAQLSSKLVSSAARPDIRGYKPHDKQRVFHESDTFGKFFLGGNRAGKCLIEGTMVMLADGSVKAIEAMSAGDMVIAPDGTATRVTAVWDQGMKEVYDYEIGRYQDVEVVTCTKDHKFWVLGNAFKKQTVKALPIGKLNRDARILRSNGTKLGGKRVERAYVLGLMLGDGHFSEKSPGNLQFTCADPSLLNSLTCFIPRQNVIQYGFNEGEREMFFDWFKSLGLLGTRSGTKFIPQEVWSWDEESIGAVIAGLAVTDGSWWQSDKGENHFSFTSKSLQLVNDFRRLAGVRLGIWGSTVNVGSKGTGQITYGTKEALAKLALLPLTGVKKQRAVSAVPLRDSKATQVRVKKETYVGKRHCYDITVEHESHCFMLANGIFTSNTVAGVAEDIFWLKQDHPYRDLSQILVPGIPTRGRVVGVDFQALTQIIIPEYKRWIPPSLLIDGSWEKSYSITDKTLILENGATVDFKTYEQDMDKHAGTSRHFVHFDEEPPKHIFNENLLRLLDTNGNYWVTMTPLLGVTWIHDDYKVEEHEDDKVFVEKNATIIFVSTRENPNLDAKQQNLIFGGLSDEERKSREEGKFVERGGKVFKTWNRSTHVIEPFIPPKTYALYMSIDSGWTNPTAILWHAVSPDGDVYTFNEIYQNETTVNTFAQMIHEFEKSIGWVPEIRTGDPALKQTREGTGTSLQQEYAHRGIYLSLDNVPTGAGSVAVGIERMQQYVGNREVEGKITPKHWYITENCTNLIREMGRLRWATFASRNLDATRNPQEQVHKKDDHAFDSSRYFFTLMPDLSPDSPMQKLSDLKQGKPMSYLEGLIAQQELVDEGLLKDLSVSSERTQWHVESFSGNFYS